MTIDAPAPIQTDPPKEKDIFGRVPKDRPDWSHRRGEPRVFALVWMLFLMGVTGIMFASLSDAFFVSPGITRPAARGMLLATTAGIVLMWPALRLSQQPAERPVRFVLRDLFVLLIPAQAVIWPNALRELGDWPLLLLLALAAMQGAWALVIGGLIALADATAGRRRAPASRGLWMLAVIAVVLAAPLAGLWLNDPGGADPTVPRPGWMFSPFTAVLEITRERDAAGIPVSVTPIHFRLIAATACAGAGLLCLAGALGTGRRRVIPG